MSGIQMAGKTLPTFAADLAYTPGLAITQGMLLHPQTRTTQLRAALAAMQAPVAPLLVPGRDLKLPVAEDWPAAAIGDYTHSTHGWAGPAGSFADDEDRSLSAFVLLPTRGAQYTFRVHAFSAAATSGVAKLAVAVRYLELDGATIADEADETLTADWTAGSPAAGVRAATTAATTGLQTDQGGQWVALRLTRLASDGDDTLVGALMVLGVECLEGTAP